jgi:uncharacterized protein YjhX (UPF0386 family)
VLENTRQERWSGFECQALPGWPLSPVTIKVFRLCKCSTALKTQKLQPKSNTAMDLGEFFWLKHTDEVSIS